MLGRPLYFCDKAWCAVRQTPGLSMLTAGTICAALCVLGLSAMALQNLEGLALVWGRAGSIGCMVADDVVEARWPALRSSLNALPGVQHAVIITPHEALERFRARSSEAAALVAGVEDDMLPMTVELTLEGGFNDLQKIATVAQAAKEVPGVASVDFGEQELATLSAWVSLLRYSGWFVGCGIALATALIVANTIRLVVYAQRDEIAILSLVGATPSFIAMPFLLEGLLWGGVGGATGAGVLWALDHWLARRITAAAAQLTGGLDVRLFATHLGLALVATGLVLGFVGSALAVRRFLNVEAV